MHGAKNIKFRGKFLHSSSGIYLRLSLNHKKFTTIFLFTNTSGYIITNSSVSDVVSSDSLKNIGN